MSLTKRIASTSLLLSTRNFLVGLMFLSAASEVPAAVTYWSAGGANTNWSTAGNWTGGALANGDTVIFTNAGLSASAPVISNVVDSSFSISSLRYSQTNMGMFHNTLILPGVTLSITNNNGPSSTALFVGTTNDPGTSLTNYTTISGSGGATLLITNNSANILVGQGSTIAAALQRAYLDMSGLDYFTATVNRLGVAARQTFTTAVIVDATAGTMYLAKTNNITIKSTLASYPPNSNKAYPLVVGDTSNAAKSGFNYLFLGLTNAIFADAMAFGTYKSGSSGASGGAMLFNPVFIANNPTAYFRGVTGAGSRVSVWTIGDQNGQGGSNAEVGTNDFSGGTVDALVNSLLLGIDATENSGQVQRGVLTFSAGTFNVNNLTNGYQCATTAGNNQGPCVGIVNVNGANAALTVNSILSMGHTTLSTALSNANITASYGALNVNTGSVFANKIIVGAVSITNVIRLNGGTLIVSNTLATNATGLYALGMTNSVLGFTVAADGSLRGLVKTLSTGGATNVIQLDAAPVLFGSYPQQIPLIKYTTWTGTNNFGLTNLPAWAASATLVSNGLNSSLDLSLPGDPRPVIVSQPTPYGGAVGDNVNFTVGISSYSAAPLSYQWFNGATPVVDGATGNGSTISGSGTATLSINTAQETDNGYYTVVITNSFGSVTSSVATLTVGSGDIAPTLTGPNNQTAIQGNNATFTASASGVPAPTFQWRRNGVDISGETAASLVVTNVQYATDNGAVFSIVASNAAGSKTNSATLSVLVPPAITSQPVSVVVTNTQAASFTIGATGVPAPTYQWYKNASPIANATNATYTIASTTPASMGNYNVVASNAAGSTNSVTVTLTVNSTMSATTLAPANGATGVGYDTPLYLTFSAAPTLRTAGTITIYNVNDSITPVDTIDLSLCVTPNATYAKNVQPRNIGGDSFTNFPVIITGNTAAIYPHLGVLTSNQTYYVTVDNGTFTDAAGAYFAGITATNVWKFSTKAGGPANPVSLVVAADGSADFVTVQGAVDAVPANNTTPTLITIKDGNYVEIVNIKSKHNLTLRGQSRNGTIVGYANNANLQPSTHFRMAVKINANDIAFDNLSVTNRTPAGGAQAEALMLESNAKRFIFNNCNLGSFQDTLLANGGGQSQAYFNNSLITGQFDYIWGGGVCFFTNCEARTMLGTGGNWNLVATRTDNNATGTWPGYNGLASSNGFSFINCRLTRESGSVSKITLAGSNGTTNGVAAWINCIMTLAYTNQSVITVTNSELLWEYGNTNMTGGAISFGLGIGASAPALTTSDARYLAASSATNWLYGWQPSLAPNILTNPVGLTVNYASPATFTVAATGIPDPTYQWQHAGTNITDATNATLTIPSTVMADAGGYAVIVTTSAGSATSSIATLVVIPPPNAAPVFTAPIPGTNIAINVGVSLAVGCTATDSDTPAQTLTYALLAGPSGAAVDSGSGNFTWRPTVAQSDFTNSVSVKVTDNGTPNLSTTNNFTVTVNPLAAPLVTAPAVSGGQFSLTITGQTGPDYTVQVSTNLASGNWQTILTTNSPAMPFTFTDTNGSLPLQFYRILVGP